MAIIDRVKVRLSGENPSADFLAELITTMTDRINLRLGTEALPEVMESVAVDATVKLYRRRYYSGIQSEGDDGLTASFVEDILDEYAEEFARYRAEFAKAEDGNAKGLVRFL